jgi:signal transduction histidine kinase
MEHSPSIHLTLLAGYGLSSVLTFFNVWLTARLRFASQHDLRLATVLLIFAGGIAMVLGYLLSSTLAARIQALDDAARRIAAGDLATRLRVGGIDEMAKLGATFNYMAAQLDAVQRKQQELDLLRRDLVAWAGHDLQTPLASVRAIVEALADGVIDEPQAAQRYLRTARREIEALSTLIDDLFQMAQMDAGGLQLDRQPAALSDLISDTLESFGELATRQGVRLEGSVAPGVDPTRIDTRRVGRVLSNLVSNALRYTPPQGAVTVRAWREKGEARVEVADTGQGIPAEQLPRIFERFYRGDRSRNRATGGSGLGLAIARGIIEAHGGRIWVESSIGQGTVITFTLPDAS